VKEKPNISFEKDAHYAALHLHLSSWTFDDKKEDRT